MLLTFSVSTGKKARILTAEGLALGCEIATSKKKARDLVDGSFHRSGPLDPDPDFSQRVIRGWVLTYKSPALAADLLVLRNLGTYPSGSCKMNENTG